MLRLYRKKKSETKKIWRIWKRSSLEESPAVGQQPPSSHHSILEVLYTKRWSRSSTIASTVKSVVTKIDLAKRFYRLVISKHCCSWRWAIVEKVPVGHKDCRHWKKVELDLVHNRKYIHNEINHRCQYGQNRRQWSEWRLRLKSASRRLRGLYPYPLRGIGSPSSLGASVLASTIQGWVLGKLSDQSHVRTVPYVLEYSEATHHHYFIINEFIKLTQNQSLKHSSTRRILDIGRDSSRFNIVALRGMTLLDWWVSEEVGLGQPQPEPPDVPLCIIDSNSRTFISSSHSVNVDCGLWMVAISGGEEKTSPAEWLVSEWSNSFTLCSAMREYGYLPR